MNKNQSTILKALAILAVAGYHFQFNLVGEAWQITKGQGFVNWLNQVVTFVQQNPKLAFSFPLYFGFIGVHVFFVLSGYGLAKKYLVGGASGPAETNLKNIWKQSSKLLIPYWIAMPVTHLLNYGLRVVSYGIGSLDYLPGWWQIYQPWQYVTSFFVFTRWLSNRMALNFVGTWWFVGVIFQFYLLLPVLVYAVRKIGAKRLFAIALGVTFVYRYWAAVYTVASPVGLANAYLLQFINFPARWAEFALGMYLATGTDIKFTFKHGLAGVGVIILGVVMSSYVVGLVVSDFLMALGAILLGGFILQGEKWLKKIQMLTLGKKSYFIYLYHEPALHILMSWFN